MSNISPLSLGNSYYTSKYEHLAENAEKTSAADNLDNEFPALINRYASTSFGPTELSGTSSTRIKSKTPQSSPLLPYPAKTLSAQLTVAPKRARPQSDSFDLCNRNGKADREVMLSNSPPLTASHVSSKISEDQGAYTTLTKISWMPADNAPSSFLLSNLSLQPFAKQLTNFLTDISIDQISPLGKSDAANLMEAWPTNSVSDHSQLTTAPIHANGIAVDPRYATATPIQKKTPLLPPNAPKPPRAPKKPYNHIRRTEVPNGQYNATNATVHHQRKAIQYDTPFLSRDLPVFIDYKSKAANAYLPGLIKPKPLKGSAPPIMQFLNNINK